MTTPFTSFHSFKSFLRRYYFNKKIKEAGGQIIETKKIDSNWVSKISNPNHQMKSDPEWYNSNINFFKQSLSTF